MLSHVRTLRHNERTMVVLQLARPPEYQDHLPFFNCSSFQLPKISNWQLLKMYSSFHLFLIFMIEQNHRTNYDSCQQLKPILLN